MRTENPSVQSTLPEAVPSWKFWHPLPFWQVLVIALVAEIACTMPFVALRELAGIEVPAAVGAGIGGAAMWVAIRWFAQRRLAAER